MPTPTALPRCVATMIRMEHPECLAAVTLDAGFPIEIGLLPPGVLGKEWAVTVHNDCDPKDPSRGSSGVESFATREEAEAGFRKEAANPEANRVHILYCTVGKSKAGKPCYINNDGMGISFADTPDRASLLLSATQAHDSANYIPKYSTYYGADNIDLKSFEVHRVEIHLRRVKVDRAVRSQLAGRDAEAPEGWSFMVADSDMEDFAASERHYSKDTHVSEAPGFHSLRDAVKRLDAMPDGWQVVLARRAVSDLAIEGPDLDAIVTGEAEVNEYKIPPADLTDVVEYRPFS